MWGGGEQQQVRGGLGQALSEAVTGHGLTGATEAVGLIDHHQIPAGVDQVFKAFTVVARYLLCAPAAAGVHRLDGIEGADHLVVLLPEVLLWADAEQLPPGGEVAGLNEVKGLVEVGV